MARCIECTYCKNTQCINENGKLFGIKLSNQLAEAEHDCEVFDEATYKITLKGCLYLAINNLNLSLAIEEIDKLYDEFIKIATDSKCLVYNEI